MGGSSILCALCCFLGVVGAVLLDVFCCFLVVWGKFYIMCSLLFLSCSGGSSTFYTEGAFCFFLVVVGAVLYCVLSAVS